MRNGTVRFFVMVFVMQGVFFGCSRTDPTVEGRDELARAHLMSGVDYVLEPPAGWVEVAKKEDVKKLVFWGLVNYNHTVHAEQPLFRAWCGPDESHSFLTVMEVKRHRNIGVGMFYGDLIRFLKEQGWKMQETGTAKIDNAWCKWWIQAVPGGDLHQQCFLVAHGSHLYALAFTTSYMTDDKQKLFMQIAQSMNFREGA